MTSIWVRRFCLVVTCVTPLLALAFFQGRLNHYSALLEKYECNRAVCNADFDGDGIPGKLFVESDKSASNFDSWFVVEDSGQQLIKQPRRSLDSSLRTHAAVINESPNSRLIIYDHIRDGGPPRNLVFVYDGSGRMTEVQPTKTDQDVFAALAVTDDAGTRTQWLLFQLVAKPLLLCYLVALAVIIWYKRRKPQGAIDSSGME